MKVHLPHGVCPTDMRVQRGMHRPTHPPSLINTSVLPCTEIDACTAPNIIQSLPLFSVSVALSLLVILSHCKCLSEHQTQCLQNTHSSCPFSYLSFNPLLARLLFTFITEALPAVDSFQTTIALWSPIQAPVFLPVSRRVLRMVIGPNKSERLYHHADSLPPPRAR